MEQLQLELVPDSPPKFKIRKVVLSCLPPDDSLYCAPPPAGMERSMAVLGLLQAIGVIEQANGLYQICWGRKRVKTARKLGWISIEAKVYEPGTSTQALMTLVENEQRRESLDVQLTAIESLRLSIPDEEISRLVGINKSQLKQAVALIDGLVPTLREALRQGRMAESTALKAIRLTPEQQEDLAMLERIRAQDVQALLQEKMANFIGKLPDVMFEMPTVSWQKNLRQKLQEVRQLTPSDRPDIVRAVEAIEDLLDHEEDLLDRELVVR
jgi:ParB-like chromosome segregation protein Spo0J